MRNEYVVSKIPACCKIYRSNSESGSSGPVALRFFAAYLINDTGGDIANQPYYEVIQNFFEARNNDGANPYNKATFSTEMALKLLDIYAQPESIVLDPFMGTGTTGVACMMRNLNFIGVEISKDQTEYAQHRIEEYAKESR